MLSICSSSHVLYSAASGVKRVHVCILCRYYWMFAFAMFMTLCVDVMVMYAYVVSFTGAYVVGVADVYMLKSVDDRTPPCRTPFLNCRC